MNLVKNSNCLIQNTKWFSKKKIIFLSKKIHQKRLPPLHRKSEEKMLQVTKPEEHIPEKVNRIQRDIFGATILPQNLSFENSKKLTDNQVKLKDIPLVDENEGELLVEQKMKGKRAKLPKEEDEIQPKEEDEIIVIDTSLIKLPKKQSEDLLCIADPYESIPGPKLFRNVLNIFRTTTRQLTVFSLFQLLKANALNIFMTYGPIVSLPEVLGGKIVLISRSDHISSVFEQDKRYPINSTFDSVQRSRLRRYSKHEHRNPHLCEEDWRILRKSVTEVTFRAPEEYFEGIEEITSKFCTRIRNIRNKQNEVPEDFLFEINKWSLECLCYVLFSKTFGFLDGDSGSWPLKTSQLLYSLTVATDNFCNLETGFQLWRFMNTTSLASLASACDILENIFSDYVVQVQLDMVKKKNHGDGTFQNLPFIEGMLLQRDQTPQDVVSNILDAVLIGTNTMSVALSFLFYHLAQNPRVQRKLWKEVNEILPQSYNRFEYEQLNSLKYLKACLKESLRLKMPIPILTRVLSQNIIISNYQIPKGTFILMTPQVEGMKEENFHDPEEFIPERWLDHEYSLPLITLPMRNYYLDSFEKQMAEVSLWFCTMQIIRHFSIEYLYEDIQATNTVISFPNKPLKFVFEDRRN